MSNDLEIIEVPINESETDSEDEFPQPPKEKKTRKRRVVSEEGKKKLAANLVKAREKRAALRAQKIKERTDIEKEINSSRNIKVQEENSDEEEWEAPPQTYHKSTGRTPKQRPLPRQRTPSPPPKPKKNNNPNYVSKNGNRGRWPLEEGRKMPKGYVPFRDAYESESDCEDIPEETNEYYDDDDEEDRDYDRHIYQLQMQKQLKNMQKMISQSQAHPKPVKVKVPKEPKPKKIKPPSLKDIKLAEMEAKLDSLIKHAQTATKNPKKTYKTTMIQLPQQALSVAPVSDKPSAVEKEKIRNLLSMFD